MRTLFAVLLLAAAPVAAQTWAAAPSLGTARAGAAVAVLDGRVYVVGGRDTGGAALRSAEVFTPGAGWAPISDLDDVRADAAAVVIDGRVVVVGGSDEDGDATDDAEVYDPVRDRWESFQGLETEREGLGAAALGGTAFVIGGADETGTLLATAEAFDGSGDWDEVDDWTLAPGRAQAGVVAAGGSVVVVGGFSALGPLARAERYTPGAGAGALPDLPTARGGVAAAATADRVIVAGGRDAADTVRRDVDLLTLGAGAWAALPDLPQAREGAVAAVVGNALYVIGGADAFGSALASVVQLSLEGIDTDSGPENGPALALAGPNPTRGPSAFAVRAPRPGHARVAVFDAVGREVAVLLDRAIGTEPVRVEWAGAVPAGVYLVRLAGPTGTAALRVTVAR